MPAVWAPAHVRATTDLSEFYEKSPAEMSRYELQELERILKMEELGEEEDEFDHVPAVDEDGNVMSPE